MTPASSYSVIFFMLCCVALKCLWVDRECLQAPGWQAKPCVMLGTEKFFDKRHCVNTLLFSQNLPNKNKHKHKNKTKPTTGMFWSLFNRSIGDLWLILIFFHLEFCKWRGVAINIYSEGVGLSVRIKKFNLWNISLEAYLLNLCRQRSVL